MHQEGSFMYYIINWTFFLFTFFLFLFFFCCSFCLQKEKGEQQKEQQKKKMTFFLNLKRMSIEIFLITNPHFNTY
jgi:membrane-associated HD superfamily phosphohydrolase